MTVAPQEPPAPPLAGVRVVEIGRYISAPLASMLLADLGADVVKVESPEGDPFRRWRPGQTSPRFLAFNRGKRSVVLDLRSPEGGDRLDGLLSDADVLIHNFRPEAAARLGLTRDVLAERFPRLVLCAVTGAGDAPSMAGRPMYDAIGQALGGLMSVLSDTADPVPSGPSISDMVTGMNAAYGVLAALLGRAADGLARDVEVSMIGATFAFVGEAVTHYTATGRVPDAGTRPRQSQSYAFTCADGLPLVVHLSTPDKFWRALLDQAGRPELAADPRFATYNGRVEGYTALHAELAPSFRTRHRDTWLEVLAGHDIPCAPLLSVDEVMDQPYAGELGLLAALPDEAEGDLLMPARAVRMPGLAPLVRPPRLGEHDAEVLGDGR